MTLMEQVTDCLAAAVENHEAAGLSVMVRRCGTEVLYTQAGMADAQAGRPIRRDSIFRMYSQSKPVTAAAVMLLMERGVIDLADPVEKFLPGFHGQQVWTEQGLTPAVRPVTLMDLLSMTAGLSYPDADAPGQAVARLFEANTEEIRRGGGMTTVALCDRLGEQPLAFQPGTRFRYSTCADVLGAVVEVASGKRFGDFLREELFEPLGMEDTGFFVPESKRGRLVTCYRRVPGGVEPYQGLHLCVGDYTRAPAFESGGAGLVSTLADYAAFADMLMNDGVYQGQRILSPASVAFLRTPQIADARYGLWDSLDGYGYGKLMRVCVEPGRVAGLTSLGEYGWDGWLGTYFCNLPKERTTLLMMQNTTDTGTAAVTRKFRNLVMAAISRGEL